MLLKIKKISFVIQLVCIIVAASFAFTAVVELPQNRAEAADRKKRRKRINVRKLKKQYWDEKEEPEVVQNRLYSKARRLEISTFYSGLNSDPFLDVSSVGFTLGFHFTELISTHLLAWQAFSKPSVALEILESEVGTTTNNNPPHWYAGVESRASVVYGKLSFLGALILYYDLYAMAGVGITGTESGNNFTPHLGIGQQIYLTNYLALRGDYRIMRYTETINKKADVTAVSAIGDRTNWTHAASIGLSLYLF